MPAGAASCRPVLPSCVPASPRAGYRLLDSLTPIQAILLDSSAQALQLAQALWQRGFWVAAIRPPTVPSARLRITLSAAHSETEVASLLAALLELERDIA